MVRLMSSTVLVISVNIFYGQETYMLNKPGLLLVGKCNLIHLSYGGVGVWHSMSEILKSC